MGTRNALFEKAARDLGVDFDQEIRAVPKYEVSIENDGTLYVAGQVPRIGSSVCTTDMRCSATRLCVGATRLTAPINA